MINIDNEGKKECNNLGINLYFGFDSIKVKSSIDHENQEKNEIKRKSDFQKHIVIMIVEIVKQIKD